MKFKDYIKEKELGLYRPTKEEIRDAKKELGKKENINPKFLKYVFVQDWRPIVKRVELAFSIEDKNHERYKSTIHFEIYPKWGGKK